VVLARGLGGDPEAFDHGEERRAIRRAARPGSEVIPVDLLAQSPRDPKHCGVVERVLVQGRQLYPSPHAANPTSWPHRARAVTRSVWISCPRSVTPPTRADPASAHRMGTIGARAARPGVQDIQSVVPFAAGSPVSLSSHLAMAQLDVQDAASGWPEASTVGYGSARGAAAAHRPSGG
jgi:hypothetical protein